LATVTLKVKQYTNEGVTHINVGVTATGGIKGADENRTLDWIESVNTDHTFGVVKTRSRWVDLSNPDLVDDFFREGWIDSNEEAGGTSGERFIQIHADAEAGWSLNEVWGFATFEGKRRYTKRIVATKGNEVKRVKLVYDYKN
jgi:hypothetical protein